MLDSLKIFSPLYSASIIHYINAPKLQHKITSTRVSPTINNYYNERGSLYIERELEPLTIKYYFHAKTITNKNNKISRVTTAIWNSQIEGANCS
jgi:hypothetical protein